jgi:hypothetical protein
MSSAEFGRQRSGDIGAGAEVRVSGGQPGELGDAQPGLDRDQKHAWCGW